MRTKFGVSLLLTVLMLLSMVVSVEAANSNPNVAPVNSSAYGKTYSQWAEAWYQWTFTLWGGPVDLFGPGDCATANQTEKVFFLTGVAGDQHSRNCTVPTGTPLFFPVLNTAYFEDPAVYDPNMSPPYVPATWVSLVKQALAPDNLELQAWIDGKPVNNLRDYLVFTDPNHPFPVNIPAFGISGWEGVQGGSYLLLHPLSAGQHTIRLFAQQFNDVEIPVPPGIFPAAFGAFTIDLTINLTVVPGQK